MYFFAADLVRRMIVKSKIPLYPKQPLFICIFVLHLHYTIPFKTLQEGKFGGYCG